MKKNVRHLFGFFAALLVVALLSACGGGGSSNRGPGVQPAENTPPVANAGADQEAVQGNLVVLDGTGSSDADEDPLTFLWSFVAKPEGSAAELSDPAAARPTFRADQAGNFVVELIVSDGIASSTAASVTISVIPLSPVTAEIAEWPYNLSAVVREIDSNADGSPDSTYTYEFSYNAAGRVQDWQRFFGDAETPSWTESFGYSNGLLTSSIRQGSSLSRQNYSRIYEYNNAKLVTASASGEVQNVYSYEYNQDGRLAAYVKNPGNFRNDLQYDGDLMAGEFENDAAGTLNRAYVYQGNRYASETLVLDGVDTYVTNYLYDENGRLTSRTMEVYINNVKADWKQTATLHYSDGGALAQVVSEERYNGAVIGVETLHFLFNPNGMPAPSFACPYPLYGTKKEPLLPRILKTFLDAAID